MVQDAGSLRALPPIRVRPRRIAPRQSDPGLALGSPSHLPERFRGARAGTRTAGDSHRVRSGGRFALRGELPALPDVRRCANAKIKEDSYPLGLRVSVPPAGWIQPSFRL